MKRALALSCVTLFAFAAAAGVSPERTHSITPTTDEAYVLRADPGGPALMVVNRADHPEDVAITISDAARVVRSRYLTLQPGQAVPLATLLSPVSEAMVVIDADRGVSVETLDGAAFALRDRRMADGATVVVERIRPEPVPFFVANASPAPLHVEIESDGRRAGVEIGGGQVAEFADLFAGFPTGATTVVIHSATAGATWFAGPSRVRFGVRAGASLGRRRLVSRSSNVTDCPSAQSAYQSALAEMQQFVQTPITVPAAPKVDYSCSAAETIDEYTKTVMDPETSRLIALEDLRRKMELLGCSALPSSSDITPLFDRLAKKEALLPKAGDAPEKHVPVLAAMLEIERLFQFRGYASANPDLAFKTAAAWLPADEQYFLDRIINQHDYKGSSTVINLARALALLTGDDANLDALLEKLRKAMTFRLEISVETISTLAGMTIRFKSVGKGTVEGVGIDSPSRGPITFTEEKGSATGGGQTCTFSPGAPSESGLDVVFDPCAQPPVTIRIQGLVGAQPGGTWTCPAGLPGFNGAIDLYLRVAFNIDPASVPPKDLAFDDKPIRAPALQNLSATAIDDVWAGTGSWAGMTHQGQIHITMTHEPKQ